MMIMRFVFALLMVIAWMVAALSALRWVHSNRIPKHWEQAMKENSKDFFGAWNFLGGYWMWRMDWSPSQFMAQKKEMALRVLCDPYHLPTQLFENEMHTRRQMALLLLLVSLGVLHSWFVGGIVLLFVLLYYLESYQKLSRRAKQKAFMISQELPEMLTQFILSLRAGILPLETWKEVAENGKGVLYEEMKHVLLQVASGDSLRVAAGQFGSQYDVHGLSDCAQLFSRSMEVGGNELAEGLERIRTILYEEKKRNYKIEAARASERMLFPELLLFTGILILVLAPMLSHGV